MKVTRDSCPILQREGLGRGSGGPGQREYFENRNQGNTARTKHTSQHNYPPSVIWTKERYLVSRTDPVAPGLGSSWKLLCVPKLVPLTLCTQFTGVWNWGDTAMPQQMWWECVCHTDWTGTLLQQSFDLISVCCVYAGSASEKGHMEERSLIIMVYDSTPFPSSVLIHFEIPLRFQRQSWSLLHASDKQLPTRDCHCLREPYLKLTLIQINTELKLQ